MSGITCNMGRTDRIIRFLVGGVLIYVTLFDATLIHSNAVRYILVALAIGNILSAMVSFCPMYVPAGISTLKKSPENKN